MSAPGWSVSNGPPGGSLRGNPPGKAAELKVLPHDVELSDRVLARVGRGRADTG